MLGEREAGRTRDPRPARLHPPPGWTLVTTQRQEENVGNVSEDNSECDMCLSQADHTPESSVSKAEEVFLSGHRTGLPSRPREAPCWGAPAPISSWVPTVTANSEAWMLESSRTSAPQCASSAVSKGVGVPVPLSVCTGNGYPLALHRPLTPRSLSPVPGQGL